MNRSIPDAVSPVVAALALLLSLQDLARLCDALEDDAIDVRDAAEARLRAAGDRALGLLQARRSSGCADARARILSLLRGLGQGWEEHDALERRRALKLDRVRARDEWYADIEGARFAFSARPWLGGVVLRSHLLADLDGEIEYDIARVSDADGRERRIERCHACPHLVYVPDAERVRARLRGLRRWYSRHPVAFERPREGDFRRIGGFMIDLGPASVRVVSSRGMSEAVLASTCEALTFEPEVLSWPREETRPFGWLRRRRIGWCDCEDAPPPAGPGTVPGTTLQVFPTPRGRAVSECERITLVFRKPVEESFDVEGPLVEP